MGKIKIQLKFILSEIYLQMRSAYCHGVAIRSCEKDQLIAELR